MKHLSEEQIVLLYYGDENTGSEIRGHLAACDDCRNELEQVQSLLRRIGPGEIPEPPPGFEEKTWLRLRDQLPEKRAGLFRRLTRPGSQWAMAGTMAVLVVVAFLAGRFWPRPAPPDATQTAEAIRQRVVLTAVSSHLERSRMFLVDIMNSGDSGPADFTSEKAEARDLLDNNRLYRVSAQQANAPHVARMLEDLDRVLAEIANGASQVSPGDLQQVRHTIQSEDLLFRMQVVGSEVNSKIRRPEPGSGRGVQRI
jgi:hypothetical protein